MVNGFIKTALLLFAQLYMNVPPGIVQMSFTKLFFVMPFILVICISMYPCVIVFAFCLKKLFSGLSGLDRLERIIDKLQICEP